MTPLVHDLESKTILQFLSEHLQTQDAIDLVGAITGLEVWWEKCITMLIRDDIEQSDDPQLDEIVGGTDGLPRGMADAISAKVDLHLNTEVREIHASGEGVHLVYADVQSGTVEDSDEDFVLCTLPFSVLRRLVLRGVSPVKHRAIRNLSYASSIKVLLHCRSRFWEDSYGVYGGGSQTDLINRQVYYPSDPTAYGAPIYSGGTASVVGHFDLRPKVKFAAAAPTPRSGVLVGSYAWGADARRMGAIKTQERSSVVARAISEFHPEILAPGMVMDSASMYWDEYRWAGGAFCFMQPRDFELYYAGTRQAEKRLFFAGEHCSLDQGWIQGAIRSALEATHDIVGK